MALNLRQTVVSFLRLPMPQSNRLKHPQVNNH